MIKKRLVQLLSHAKKYVFLQVLFNWLSLWCQIGIIWAVSDAVYKIYHDTLHTNDLYFYGCIVAVSLILRYIFDRISTKMSFAASADVKRILREKIYGKLLKLGASYREQTQTSAVVQLAVEGVDQLETYFGKYLSQLFYSLLAPLTLFVVLSFVNFKSSLVLLICVPLIPVSIVVVQKIAKRLLSKYWGAYEQLGDSFLENLQGLTTMKIYSADEKAATEMDKESEHFRKITMKVLTMQLNSTSVMDIMAYGGAAVGMIFVLSEFMNGAVNLAGAMMIILLASEFFIPLRLLGSFFHIAMNGMAASDKIFALLDLPEPKNKGETLSDGKTDIALKDVCFSYNEERRILNNINLNVKNGGMVSVVGMSGSGKSTIAGILMGRNKNYKGSITIQGKELSDIAESDLMKNITLVTHECHIFKGTVRYNLLMGKPDASEKEMFAALEKAKLKEFIMENGGLDMVLNEGGTNLSGGQRQRLSLARALLHDSPVYIFDEATGNIDMESEEMIMSVIKELAKTKTVLQISHRLANVVDSEKIYMLDGGKVAESGSHAELMKKNGKYAELFTYQKNLENYGLGGETA